MTNTADLTIIYYTANHISEEFARNTREQLLIAAKGTPIISVSKKPMEFGRNIFVGDTPRNHNQTWRQALIGAKAAKTKYIAMAEDDIFYSPDHFVNHRGELGHVPTPGVFAYNGCVWSLHTWGEPMFSWHGRRVMHSLVCERDLFVETIEELFAQWPEGVPPHIVAEPGRMEKRQKITPRETEMFWPTLGNVAINHESAIGYEHYKRRKKHGKLKVTGLPYWGTPEEVLAKCAI